MSPAPPVCRAMRSALAVSSAPGIGKNCRSMRSYCTCPPVAPATIFSISRLTAPWLTQNGAVSSNASSSRIGTRQMATIQRMLRFHFMLMLSSMWTGAGCDGTSASAPGSPLRRTQVSRCEETAELGRRCICESFGCVGTRSFWRGRLRRPITSWHCAPLNSMLQIGQSSASAGDSLPAQRLLPLQWVILMKRSRVHDSFDRPHPDPPPRLSAREGNLGPSPEPPGLQRLMGSQDCFDPSHLETLS